MDKKKLSRDRFTGPDRKCYNTDKADIEVSAELVTEEAEKMEVESMAELLERMNNYEIPPHIAQQLGLGKDWKKNVSKEFMQQVLHSVNQYKSVLKKLSDK